MELLEYVVDFEKRSSIKSHVLVDLWQNGQSPTQRQKARCPKHCGWFIAMEL
jgi:hypothetical protein